jgi:hypothetical protein
VVVPYDRYSIISSVYENGTVKNREETAGGVRLRASVPRSLAEALSAYATRP